MKTKIFIIAEAGVNHNGSLDMALRLIDAAADAGADAVKFQTFKSEAVISRFAVKAEYQAKTTGDDESQLEMVKKLELSADAHVALVEHCKKRSIQFLSTPFDLESVNLLVDKLKVSQLKIPSGEITNAPLILKCAQADKPVILSTGMSTLGDIEDALGVLAFGYIGTAAPPSCAAFSEAYLSLAGQAALKKNVTLLHCTTEYPAPIAEVNLRVMQTMSHAFGLPVGYSDHTEGVTIPVAAVSLGATVIEKHFTLDRTLPGPDHKASLEPQELAQMVKAIRQTECALGTGAKLPSPSERKNMAIARKSIVAARDIRAGEVLNEENMTTKRPGGGLSPMSFWDVIGKQAQRDYLQDEAI